MLRMVGKKIMNIIELFAKSRRKSGGIHRIPMLIYGRQQVDGERRRVCGDYVRCIPAAREGAIGGNERSLFNHVFIFGCYMTPFVSLGV